MSPSLTPHRPYPPGFTLIEMLVVISIIAALVAILIPVLSSARNAGKATVCMSNMRQLAVATTGYSLDYNKYLPQPHQEGSIGTPQDAGKHLWFNAVDYYLNQQSKNYSTSTNERNYVQFKQDPVWLGLDDDLPGTEPDRRNQQTIKMNAYFGNSNINIPIDSASIAFVKVTDVPSPATTVIFVDGRAFDTPSTTTGNIDGAFFNANASYVGLRHNDGANLTMVDGSVQHQINPVELTGSGYRGWYDMYENTTFTPAERELWPEAIFNFRPKDYDRERRYPPQN